MEFIQSPIDDERRLLIPVKGFQHFVRKMQPVWHLSCSPLRVVSRFTNAKVDTG